MNSKSKISSPKNSKKTTNKKVTSKKSSNKSKSKSNLIKGAKILGLSGLAVYTLYKGYTNILKPIYEGIKTYKILTTEKSISNLFNNENDVVKFLYNPNYKEKWIGDSGLALLFLREYLITKYKNACTIENPIRSIGFLYGFNTMNVYEKNNTYLEYTDFDEICKFFKKLFDKCKYDFFILPFGIQIDANSPNIDHDNILIFNKKKNIVEHYEPHGTLNHNENEYKNFKKIFTKLGITYYSPFITCPKLGPQTIEEKCEKLTRIESEGFCILWNLWLIDLRMNNPNVNSQTLIKNSIDKLIDNNIANICVFISTYCQFVLEFSKKYNLILDNNGAVLDYTKK